jgi:predicted RNA-binding Zn ribbon-like protein
MTETQPVNNHLMVTYEAGRLPSILYLPLVGEKPCLDFINTIDWRLNPNKIIDTLQSYSDLLAFSLRLSVITAEEYASLSFYATKEPTRAQAAYENARAFRDALTSIVDATVGTVSDSKNVGSPTQEALATFNTAREKAEEAVSAVWARGRIIIDEDRKAEGLDLPWLPLVRDAYELIRSTLIQKVKLCAAEGCGWVFLDTSKNNSRRWCSMKLCGNRKKSERFRSSSQKR